MPSNKPLHLPPSEERRNLPEPNDPNQAYREWAMTRSDIPPRYLNHDGSYARDVLIIRNRDGSLREIRDYR